MAIFYFGSLERDRVLRPYVANWICLFGRGFHFFCLPRGKVKFECKNETSPWPVQNSFSYILIDINGYDILKGEKITHIPSGGWGPVGHSFFFFFWLTLTEHLLYTVCQVLSELQPYYHRGSLVSHPRTPRKAFEEKVTSCDTGKSFTN